jgi:hypothetical protein
MPQSRSPGRENGSLETDRLWGRVDLLLDRAVGLLTLAMRVEELQGQIVKQ